MVYRHKQTSGGYLKNLELGQGEEEGDGEGDENEGTWSLREESRSKEEELSGEHDLCMT